MRASLLPLLIVLAPQVALSVVQLGIPVLAPAIVSAMGKPPEAVGILGGAMGFGSVWFFAANRGVTPVLGPLRSLIAACLLAVAGAALIVSGFWAMALCGATVIGFAYAITAPAGSQILSSHTPRRIWGTLFSIRQSGVPMGGAIAGLLGAGLAAAVDWRAGLAALAAIPLICSGMLAVSPARFHVGASGARFRLRPLFDPVNVIRPFQTLRRMPQLLPLTLASLGFAIGQGSTFSFFTTYMTDGLGLSLALAGTIYSTMQVSAFAGRVLVGFIADRLGSTRLMLILMAVASSCALVLLAQYDAEWPRPLLFASAGLTGISIATWNGLFLAEIAKVAPHDEVAEATASSTFFTFVAYMITPPLFGALVWFGDYAIAYYCIAAAVLAAAAVLSAAARTESAR
jgi:MFS family permease